MTCTLELKIIPHAPRNEIVGWISAGSKGAVAELGGVLKVKVHAPALEGRANDELIDFLARELGVPRRDITLLRGEKSRQKVVHIAGLHAPAVHARIGNR